MDSSSSCCVFSSLILSTKPFSDGAMDDGGRLWTELAASSSCSARRWPWSDDRWVMGMEQHPSLAATRVTEQLFLGSTLLTSSGGGAYKRWPKHCLFHLSRVAYRSHRVMSHAVRKKQDKFFNKTTTTYGCKLECAYTTGHWAGS